MKSFSDYLKSLSENEEEDLKNLNDNCHEGDEQEEKEDKQEDDEEEIKESAQIQLDLLKQIQPKLAQAPLNVLKQVLKRLEATDKDE